MGVFGKINELRRGVMRNLTKNIGKSAEKNIFLVDKSDIKRVLICRPNGRLGNILLITPLVQEVAETFPNCQIDLFVKGTLAPIVFENYPAVNKTIHLPKKPFKSLVEYLNVWISIKKENYDMAINVDQNSSSGRLAVRFSNAKYKFYGDSEDLSELKSDYEHIAKYPVYNFRNYLTKLGLTKSNKIVAPLDLRLTFDELEKGKAILDKIIDTSKRTICLFTYATGGKCFSEEWWQSFYSRLKAEYRNYNIVEILPIENVSQIGFEAPTFYSKDIREMGAFLANVDVFIGADSGIMHLASSVQIPTVGLFSVSNIKKYEPYDGGSIGIDTENCSHGEYIQIINSILDNGKLKIYSRAAV